MSVKINYAGDEILNISANVTKKLTTKGKVCTDDITIVNTPDGADNLKIWDVTIDTDQSSDAVIITDVWLANHYNDNGLAVMVIPMSIIPTEKACAFCGFRANYTISELDNGYILNGFDGYHVANNATLSLGRVSGTLSGGDITGSVYGAIMLTQNGEIIMRCTSAYKVLAGNYRVMAWTITT